MSPEEKRVITEVAVGLYEIYSECVDTAPSEIAGILGLKQRLEELVKDD